MVWRVSSLGFGIVPTRLEHRSCLPAQWYFILLLLNSRLNVNHTDIENKLMAIKEERGKGKDN